MKISISEYTNNISISNNPKNIQNIYQETSENIFKPSILKSTQKISSFLYPQNNFNVINYSSNQNLYNNNITNHNQNIIDTKNSENNQENLSKISNEIEKYKKELIKCLLCLETIKINFESTKEKSKQKEKELRQKISILNKKVHANDFNIIRGQFDYLGSQINSNIKHINFDAEKLVKNKKKDLTSRMNIKLLDSEVKFNYQLNNKINEHENKMNLCMKQTQEMEKIKKDYMKIKNKSEDIEKLNNLLKLNIENLEENNYLIRSQIVKYKKRFMNRKNFEDVLLIEKKKVLKNIFKVKKLIEGNIKKENIEYPNENKNSRKLIKYNQDFDRDFIQSNTSGNFKANFKLKKLSDYDKKICTVEKLFINNNKNFPHSYKNEDLLKVEKNYNILYENFPYHENTNNKTENKIEDKNLKNINVSFISRNNMNNLYDEKLNRIDIKNSEFLIFSEKNENFLNKNFLSSNLKKNNFFFPNENLNDFEKIDFLLTQANIFLNDKHFTVENSRIASSLAAYCNILNNFKIKILNIQKKSCPVQGIGKVINNEIYGLINKIKNEKITINLIENNLFVKHNSLEKNLKEGFLMNHCDCKDFIELIVSNPVIIEQFKSSSLPNVTNMQKKFI